MRATTHISPNKASMLAQDMDTFLWQKQIELHRKNLVQAKPHLRKVDITNPEGSILFERKTSNRLHMRIGNIRQIKIDNQRLKNALVAIDERRRTVYGNLQFSSSPPGQASVSPRQSWGHSVLNEGYHSLHRASEEDHNKQMNNTTLSFPAYSHSFKVE